MYRHRCHRPWRPEACKPDMPTWQVETGGKECIRAMCNPLPTATNLKQSLSASFQDCCACFFLKGEPGQNDLAVTGHDSLVGLQASAVPLCTPRERVVLLRGGRWQLLVVPGRLHIEWNSLVTPGVHSWGGSIPYCDTEMS